MPLIPRMTTRRWMVVVAVVGVLCLLEHRRREFDSLAGYHGSKATVGAIISSGSRGMEFTYVDQDGNVMTPDHLKAASWHEAARYEVPACGPLPLAPRRTRPTEAAVGPKGELDVILDLEIGDGRDEVLALFDGTPRHMKIVHISFVEDTKGRTLTFEGGDAACLQVAKDGKWKCIALAGNFPDSLVERIGVKA